MMMKNLIRMNRRFIDLLKKFFRWFRTMATENMWSEKMAKRDYTTLFVVVMMLAVN